MHRFGWHGISVPVLAVSLLMPTASREAQIAETGDLARTERDDWCQTERQYRQNNSPEAADATMDGCPLEGPCDDPATRDLWLACDSTDITYIRLNIHILTFPSGYPLDTESGVAGKVALLNHFFQPVGIQLVHAAEFIDREEWRVISGGELGDLKRETAIAPAYSLNVWAAYYDLTYGTYPWDYNATNWPGGIILSSVNWLHYPMSLPHEVGHCLGLYHPFYGVDEVVNCGECYESVDHPDRDRVGDFCADTPPGPRHIQCGNAPGSDLCSELPWGYTMPENIMSYAPDSCQFLFTDQQISRMRCWLFDRLRGWVMATEFSGEPTFGGTPLKVQFHGEPIKEVTEWSWEFGDGSVSTVSDPMHTYHQPGVYNVALDVNTPEGWFPYAKEGFVTVHADTIMVVNTMANPGESARVDISIRNFLPVRAICLPVVYDGPLPLEFVSFSSEGLRGDCFADAGVVSRNDALRQLTLLLRHTATDTVYMPAGDGPVVSIHFDLPYGVTGTQNTVAIADYGIFSPELEAAAGKYEPATISGVVEATCCRGSAGNVNNDTSDITDIGDLTALIDFLFISFSPPRCAPEANCDGDPLGVIDVGDLTRLIDFLFVSQEPLPPCS
ncbi:MAG: PKD domain-containing protein [Candidatus Zixiibacteriota bacterium]|nr:MAG: PKD domain-containing protein [candidate division Zixibacteria bacterium]